MALLDLSLVTKTLIEVVRRTISISPAKPAGTLNVMALAPDQLADFDNAIGIYLYHLVEEAALKNQTWPKRPIQPLRFSPMGLNLHYIISAHSKSLESEAPFREQLLMGLTTKALHDYPIITDDTVIAGVNVMPTAMIGDENKLRISMRHVAANEAVSYWTAGSQPMRLSSYYEVSVVLIEPEEPTTATGRVLTWGVDTFIGGLPRLLATRSTIQFTIPGEVTPRTVEVQPAQPAIGDAFTMVGSGLGGGTLELLVRGPNMATAQPVGSTWGASGFGDEVTATVQADLAGTPSIPGTYAASLRMTRTRTLANGTLHTDVVLSNEAPFQIVPAISAISAPDPTGVFMVTGQIFKDPAIPIVRASIGPVQLADGTLNALAPGEVAVKSATEIQMRIPPGAPPGQVLPVRLVINGSESPPRWVTSP